jgi:hypothetical protein
MSRQKEDGCGVKRGKISDDREFYKAVRDYTSNVWGWGAHRDDDYEYDPTPDELITLLNERIEWVREHQREVDKYLRRRAGPTWVRVIEGSGQHSGKGKMRKS